MIRNVVRAVGGRVSLKAAAGAAPAQVPTAARATAHGLRAASASLAQGKGVRSFSEAAAPADGAFLCVRTLFSKAGVGVSDVSCRARSAALLHLKASACLDVKQACLVALCFPAGPL